MPFLLPDSIPTETAVYALRMPNDESIRMAFLDVLRQLLQAHRWTETPTSVSFDEFVSAMIERIGVPDFTIE